MNEVKESDKDLEAFLGKVDEIGSIIKDLSADDKKTQADALQKADNYLGETHKGRCQDGFNKSVINKIEDEPLPIKPQAKMSAEDFMKEFEEDAKKRSEKRKENKEKSLVWKEKGNSFFKNHEYLDAVQCYSEAIRLTPDEVTFYSNRAQALIKLEKYETALKDCEMGMQLNKNFVKLYVHQGRALTGLRKYEEAISAFKEVLNIDSKQEKIIGEYIDGVEKEKRLNDEDEKVNMLLEKGDKKMYEIKELISKLRKGSPPQIQQVNEVMIKLKRLVADEDCRLAFRTAKGFNIFNEHPILNRLLKQISMSREEIKYVGNIFSLLSETILDNEENSDIVSSINHILSAAMTSLKYSTAMAEKFEVIQMFFRISQFDNSRKALLGHPAMSQLLNHSLSMLEKGGDIALVAMGMINNLALDQSFVPQFEEKLSTDFIPGIVKIMELLAMSAPDATLMRSFLPVMASSISTIANLFRNAKFCKKRAENDHRIWVVSYDLLMSYMSKLNDESVYKIITATLGMLMNLSTQKIIFEKDFATKWINLSYALIGSNLPVIIERCCGILNHTLGCNEMMLKEVIHKKFYKDFMEIMKSDNASAKRFIVKCIAICVNIDEGARECVYSSKVLPALLNTLQSKDELTIGNTAMIFAHCHSNKQIAERLVHCDLVKKLLMHARNEKLSKTVRHNCAITIGKYCLADPRYLEQLRDLHGLEILHEVMKENKLV